jgi:transposase
MRTKKKLDFTDEDIFIGLDIHKKNWTVSIYTRDFEHKTFSQNPDPKILVNYLHRNFPGANYHSVYEAGYCGFWIHEELKALGVESIVINPADVPTKDKEKRNKNNKVDCRKLARSLRNEDLEPIYVPHREALEDRFLVRSRRNIVKQQTRFKNRIKAILSFYGITIPEQFKQGRWSGKFIKWLEQIEMKSRSGKTALHIEIDELKHYREKTAIINREIKALSQTKLYKRRVKNLLTIPGIGMITAMTLLVEIVDIKRFKTSDNFAGFIGLVPGERSSGPEDKVNYTGLTNRCNKYLRSMLIESAWVAARKDPALTMYYYKLNKRMIGQKVIIRVARKLLNRIRFVLMNDQEYVPAVIE